MTIVYALSREILWEKSPIKQMECMIVMLLICVNSAYEKKNYLGEEHVVFNLLLSHNASGDQEEMGHEVSTRR